MGGICPKKSKVAVAPENGSAENSKKEHKTQDNTNGNILTICTFFY